MTSSETPRFVIDTRMIKVGAALASVGMLLATVGMGLASAAVARAANDWMRQRDISPAAAAAAKLHQARRAAGAGAHAWQADGVGSGSR
ncbi:MAG TPA: hypothetical protein VFN97_15895 [Actinospica sp.]|nr:hypothetical protein [Actinospica sp.]